MHRARNGVKTLLQRRGFDNLANDAREPGILRLEKQTNENCSPACHASRGGHFRLVRPESRWQGIRRRQTKPARLRLLWTNLRNQPVTWARGYFLQEST